MLVLLVFSRVVILDASAEDLARWSLREDERFTKISEAEIPSCGK